jgi:hypothetical protein
MIINLCKSVYIVFLNNRTIRLMFFWTFYFGNLSQICGKKYVQAFRSLPQLKDVELNVHIHQVSFGTLHSDQNKSCSIHRIQRPQMKHAE